MLRRFLLSACAVCITFARIPAQDFAPPRSVRELWADVDPLRDDLDLNIVREWEQDGVVFRYVTYHVGTFKGQAARMAAFYAFPRGATSVPGLLHLHGGGQRAFLQEVDFYARQGYACLSINWGGREMENALPGDPNTDWGAVDPTQQNVPGYFNLQPGDKYLDPVESPRNNNWYLLTYAARRGLTVLERQPEVDPNRLGVYGHSMGGNLTIYVAGSDQRVKVAAPSVGGSGFRTRPWPLLPQQAEKKPNGDVALFDATLGFESYAKHIQAPTLWLGATNDFHGILDDTYLTADLIPHDDVRFAFAPHLNHRFTPEFAVTRPLWIDQHLRNGFVFPQTPKSDLRLSGEDGVPMFRVLPDTSRPIARVQVMYSIDPDPQARFWRTAEAASDGKTWSASLPILSVDQPLFALAQVYYRLEVARPVPFDQPTNEFAITSRLHTATPGELQRAGVRATDGRDVLVDDFSHDWLDWYRLSSNNPHHWEFSTRKLTDPKWRGRGGEKLALQVQSNQPNQLVLLLTRNFFRPYRGPKQEYTALIEMRGGNEPEVVALSPGDFTNAAGEQLPSWKEIDVLSLRAYVEWEHRLVGSKDWRGSQPVFQKLWWSSE